MTGSAGQQVSWHKSSHSGGGNCVEIAASGRRVRVRHSRRPESEMSFCRAVWASFVAHIQDTRGNLA